MALDFFGRMLGEQAELSTKIDLLDKALNNNRLKLDKEQRTMMDNQIHHMKAYLKALEDRVEYERKLRQGRIPNVKKE